MPGSRLHASARLTFMAIVAVLLTGAANAQMQSGQIGFHFPDLGSADRMTLSPYYDTAYGLVVTALPLGAVPGETGLVRGGVAICVFPGDADQVLGTAAAGSGDIGTGAFPVRIDFPNPVLPPASVRLDVYTYTNGVVTVTLYDADGVPVPSARETFPVAGTCPGPGTRRDYILLLAQSTPVDHVVVECTLPFVIDNFTWIEQFVAVDTATWGRIKAIYR